MESKLTQKRLHITFVISIILKGLYAMVEILGGLLFLVSKSFLALGVWLLTFAELGEDPKDFVANYLIKAASELSVSSQRFIALYLLSHGIIKLFVIVGLFKQKLWAYPASIVVFSAFIIYQLYRYSHTHSLWLLVFTLFDAFVIYLTVHEYRRFLR
jgi:uncharacterized membrane protein